MFGGDAEVVGAETEAVVAPDEGGAFDAAAGGAAGAAFAGFGGFAGFGERASLN